MVAKEFRVVVSVLLGYPRWLLECSIWSEDFAIMCWSPDMTLIPSSNGFLIFFFFHRYFDLIVV